MQYTLLTNRFGPMNLRLDPAALGPALAQNSEGVDVAGGVAVNDTNVGFTTLAYKVTSSGTFAGNQVKSTDDATSSEYDFGNPYTYHAYGDRVIRVPRALITAGWVPQYATQAAFPTWHALGIKAPVVGSFAMASGGGGAPDGTYRAVVVFYNAYGDESPPTASVSFTAASNDIDYSGIPIGYGTGDITNTSTSLTNVTNISRFRVGMCITSPTAGIPAGTYITAISGTTITLSKAATATAATITLQDVQVTGRRIYRTTAGGTTYYLAVDIGNVTATTSTGDNTADAALAVAAILPTEVDDDVLPACYGATVSPDGVLMAVLGTAGSQDVVFTKSDASMLWNPDYALDVGVKPQQCFYGLSRFLIFTRSEIFFVLGSSGADFDLIKSSAQAPVNNPATYYGGANPVEMPDGSVWFTSGMGVTRFDGSSAEAITRDVFTENQNASIGAYTFAAVVDRGRYVAVTSIDERTMTRALLFDPAIGGWRWLTNGDNASITRTTGAAWVDNSLSPPRLYYYLNTSQCLTYPNVGAGTNGVYWTGEWSGERRSSLKKFRRVSVLHDGRILVQPYVNGVAAGSSQDFTRTSLGRSVFWLPSETRGRAVSVKLTLVNTAAEVHEIGVWVGEERGPMP